MGDDLEQEFMKYLSEKSGTDGESVKDKIDESLVALRDIEKKMDRLANAKDLTPHERKVRRAIAIMANTAHHELKEISVQNLAPDGHFQDQAPPDEEDTASASQGMKSPGAKPAAKPAAAKPATAKPAGAAAKPAVGKPAAAKPQGMRPQGAKPQGAMAPGAKPAAAKPAAAKPAAAKPAAAKPPAAKSQGAGAKMPGAKKGY